MKFIIDEHMIRAEVITNYLSYLRSELNLDIPYVIYKTYYDLIRKKREFDLGVMTENQAINALTYRSLYLDKVLEEESMSITQYSLKIMYFSFMCGELIDIEDEYYKILDSIIKEVNIEKNASDSYEVYINLLTEKIDEKIKFELKKMGKNQALKQLNKKILKMDVHSEEKNQMVDDLINNLISDLTEYIDFRETELLFGFSKSDMELGKTYPMIIDISLDKKIFDINLLNYITEEVKRCQKVIDDKSAFEYYFLEDTSFKYGPFNRPSDFMYISDEDLPF